MSLATKPITAEEYLAGPDRPWTELVRGQIVMMSPASPRHGQVCGQVVYLLRSYLERADLGHVLCNDSGVLTERDPDTLRGRDVAFHSYQKVPKGPLPKGLLPVPPELVFEVLSPTDRWSDVHEKVAEYLHVGVGTVCVLDPDKSAIHVYHAERGPQTLTGEEELTLPDVLPDFRAAVSRFFG